jgi:hypothetical protein
MKSNIVFDFVVRLRYNGGPKPAGHQEGCKDLRESGGRMSP